MAVVVDDHVLFDILAGATPPDVADELNRGGVYTTASWYFRLGRALRAGGGGSLSSRLGALDPTVQADVLQALARLPDEIGLVGPRACVPVMISLRVRRPLNLLSAEALAVATIIGASLAVATESPLLRSGAADLDVRYVLLD